MGWRFDQRPEVACITCRAVLDGAVVRTVIHYEDDHSWAFLDGELHTEPDALVVAMGEVLKLHPDLDAIADLPPGWLAERTTDGEVWARSPFQDPPG